MRKYSGPESRALRKILKVFASLRPETLGCGVSARIGKINLTALSAEKRDIFKFERKETAESCAPTPPRSSHRGEILSELKMASIRLVAKGIISRKSIGWVSGAAGKANLNVTMG